VSDKLEAVRKAIAAYAAALEAIKQASPHVAGTCVMSRNHPSGYFTCSECEGNGSAGNKFCAHCGAEIIRFDDLDQPRVVDLTITAPEAEVKITKITVPKLNTKYTTRRIPFRDPNPSAGSK
jgi:hypothetical protein